MVLHSVLVTAGIPVTGGLPMLMSKAVYFNYLSNSYLQIFFKRTDRTFDPFFSFTETGWTWHVTLCIGGVPVSGTPVVSGTDITPINRLRIRFYISHYFTIIHHNLSSFAISSRTVFPYMVNELLLSQRSQVPQEFLGSPKGLRHLRGLGCLRGFMCLRRLRSLRSLRPLRPLSPLRCLRHSCGTWDLWDKSSSLTKPAFFTNDHKSLYFWQEMTVKFITFWEKV